MFFEKKVKIFFNMLILNSVFLKLFFAVFEKSPFWEDENFKNRCFGRRILKQNGGNLQSFLNLYNCINFTIICNLKVNYGIF
jgi:choline-glycine betaine transporter